MHFWTMDLHNGIKGTHYPALVTEINYHEKVFVLMCRESLFNMKKEKVTPALSFKVRKRCVSKIIIKSKREQKNKGGKVSKEKNNEVRNPLSLWQ